MKDSEKILLPNQSNLNVKQWFDLPVRKRNKMNLITINKKVVRWDELYKNWSKEDSLSLGVDYHLVFFHIFKTAGITLSKVISNNYRLSSILQANGPVINSNIYSLLKFGECMRVLIGHYEINEVLYQFLSRKRLIHLIMLRNPVERVVSYYDHIRSQKRHVFHNRIKGMSLNEFLDSNIVNDVYNGQTARILGLVKNKLIFKDPRSDCEIFKEAKSVLLDQFSLVGVVDFFDEYLIMCKKLLGWENIFYNKLNKSKLKTQIESLDSEIIEKIQSLNLVDIMVYNYFKNKFQEQKESMSINNNTLDKFLKLNQSHNQLIYNSRRL